jgi:hypothetical protein
VYVSSFPDFDKFKKEFENLSDKMFQGFKGSNLVCPLQKPNMTLGNANPNAT